MSVNININGKFAKRCTHPLLLDSQNTIKAEEKERRKLRLLEVREESKRLAKKIRDEVNEEKKRELRKLQATKEKELECWRQHALQQKGEEYREAIFQVGTAHEAARRENQEMDSKQKQGHGSYKDFKKQIAARKCQPGKVQFKCQPSCPCHQTQTTANKQLKCTCTQTDEKRKNEKEVHKRKRDFSFSTSESECEDESHKEKTALIQSLVSLSSTCDSTLSSSHKNQNLEASMFVPTKNKCLIKTPSLYVDVEVGTDDSVTISAPAEIKGQRTEYSKKFNSIIRLSPRKDHLKAQVPSSTQPSSTATTSYSETTAKEQNSNMSCLQEYQNCQLSNFQISKEKRFTIISDLVKKQQECQPRDVCSYPLPNSHATSTSITPHLSPKKQSVSNRPLATRPAGRSALISSSSSGRVQFYDYNSKLAKEQDRSATTVTVQRQRDQSLPSAMQQAEQENQKERERQLEELRKLQLTEERGQKALEREQIRRDCNDLTEKLEVLSQEYAKQLPTNDNQVHIFADKQLRKEGKMNTAIEKLLQRPTIITCSEQKRACSAENKIKTTIDEVNLGNILNVASLNNKPLPADDVSSDSCRSILLGYVDDQSRRIKQDIQKNGNDQNQTKQKRLKELLKRLDNLRGALLEELKNEREPNSGKQVQEIHKLVCKEDNIKVVMDSISDLRKEHEEILINEKDQNPKTLREREKELKAKEALLEKKLREFYEIQKQPNEAQVTQVSDDLKRSKSNEQKNVCVSGENPLEIIITVKGDTKCLKIPTNTKKKLNIKKTPSKLSTLIRSPQPSLTKTKKHTPKKKLQAAKSLHAQRMLGKQNSYDSNSTSYMSLPTELPTKLDDLAQLIGQERLDQPNKQFNGTEAVNQTNARENQQQETESSLESLNINRRYNPPPRVNPLIAQYVQRLLGMSRSAVQKLGVSSSDVDTPSSTIINTTGNVGISDTMISDEHLISLQNFIEENKSFIKDVEQSIRSQNNVSLESSLRKLDDIWRKRLKSENREATKSGKEIKKKVPIHKYAKDKKVERESLRSYKKTIPKDAKTMPNKGKQEDQKTNFNENLLKDVAKSLSSHSSEDKESTKSLKTYKRPAETVDKSIHAKMSVDSSKTESDSQIARYAKLTENCTHRIAELTELINRVREEKQRLLEVTLSSVSDNDRHSTEYLELPEGRISARNEQDDLIRVSSSSEDITQNKHSLSSNTLPEIHKLSSADKNKQTANSRDSGIAESRPLTALENRFDQEPLSQTSSESILPQAVRKMKPPPTLKRFSPQLPENEIAHELSTIFEVDTPATSRINTAVGHLAEERDNVFNNVSQQPIQFPTFEQYIQKLNLDITQLNTQQSLKLQHEFTAFLECLQQNRLSEESPKYSEFPSITAYFQKLADCDLHLGETMEESLTKLHISGIQPDDFPAVREYIRRNAAKSLQSETQLLLDTESLENITDAPTRSNTDNDNDTASIDIQEELKKRKIIKNSFRVSGSKKKQIFSSTVHKESEHYQDILAAESGIDKLSTSGNTSDLIDNDLKRMVHHWSKDVRNKSNESKILSSTTSSTNASALANSALMAASLNENCKESGRPFKLRDFLTRELKKLANNSGSTTNSSCDDTLRSNFLHSLIGSLTPRTPGVASKSGAQTLDRQKTSTPVLVQSSRAHSTASNHSSSSSQLFSGESRLSSVRYLNPSVHFIISEDANADESSE